MWPVGVGKIIRTITSDDTGLTCFHDFLWPSMQFYHLWPSMRFYRLFKHGEAMWRRRDVRSAYQSPFQSADRSQFPGSNIPSSLLPLPTNDSSQHQSLFEKAGRWVVGWPQRLRFLTFPSNPSTWRYRKQAKIAQSIEDVKLWLSKIWALRELNSPMTNEGPWKLCWNAGFRR